MYLPWLSTLCAIHWSQPMDPHLMLSPCCPHPMRCVGASCSIIYIHTHIHMCAYLLRYCIHTCILLYIYPLLYTHLYIIIPFTCKANHWKQISGWTCRDCLICALSTGGNQWIHITCSLRAWALVRLICALTIGSCIPMDLQQETHVHMLSRN